MAGPWENYQSGSASGPWQKYGAAPPSAPPPVPKPPNPILTQEEGWDPITPGNAATGFLKSLYQTSTPGIAASIAQKHAPQAAQSIPESLKGMPLEQVPAAAIATFFGGEEPTAQLAEHTVTAPGAMSLPKIGKPGMVSRVAEHLPVIGNGVRLYNLGREVFGREEAPPAPIPPAPVPQTNGIEWGSGGQGPLELRGKVIPQEAQSLPAIEKPAPRSTWPPNAPRYNPESKVELPKPKPFRDVQEDSMIQDAMRQDLSAHEQIAAMTAAKEFAAGNSMSTPKSTLIERARDQMNPWSNQPKAPEMPAKPVAPSKPVAPEAPKPPIDMSRSPADYTRSQEAQTKLGYPLPELLKDHPDWAKGWLNYEGQPTVKVYRGVEGPGTPIARGNYVSTSREGAEQYGSHVEELEVPAKHLRYVRGAETGEAANLDVGGKPELIYAPPKAKTPAPSEDLTGILRQSVKQVREKKAGTVSQPKTAPMDPKPAESPAPPTEAVAGNEPWQMTRHEWNKTPEAQKLYEKAVNSPAVKAEQQHYERFMNLSKQQKDEAVWKITMHEMGDPHKAAVKEALAAGKSVPAEVLNGYPDLERTLHAVSRKTYRYH